MRATKEYISGISYDDGSVRRYKITVQEGPKKGRSYIQEVYTPRISEFEWSDSEVVKYYIGTKSYCTSKECYEAL